MLVLPLKTPKRDAISMHAPGAFRISQKILIPMNMRHPLV